VRRTSEVRRNDEGEAQRRRWTFYEAIKVDHRKDWRLCQGRGCDCFLTFPADLEGTAKLESGDQAVGLQDPVLKHIQRRVSGGKGPLAFEACPKEGDKMGIKLEPCILFDLLPNLAG
jgi:hypothetical protein